MIIGLCGFKGSGKSVVAEYLAREHGFSRYNFKDALVSEMKENFPDLLEAMRSLHGYKDIDELFFYKPDVMRALMQNYGTNVRRQDDDNYWVDRYEEQLPNGNVVTDDVRFENELDMIRDNGGIIIRIKRSDITTGGTHVSETEQEGFKEDFTIVAEPGDHVGVYKQIESILHTLKTNTD